MSAPQRRREGTPTNRPQVRVELEAALRHEGPTLFDMLVEIIGDHGEGGSQASDRVELELG